MANAGYAKSGPISEAPANQKGSPHAAAAEVTVACFYPVWYFSENCMVGQEGWGLLLQFTEGSQVRNWVLDEVGLYQATPVCKTGSSYVTNGSVNLP